MTRWHARNTEQAPRMGIGTGRAAGSSRMLVSLLAAVLVCGACGGPRREEPTRALRESSPTPPAATRLLFAEQAVERGLCFTSVNGQRQGRLSILESLGAGVGLLDYDGDLDDDVFIVGGGDFDGGLPCGVGHAVFRNDGRGRFAVVTPSTGIPVGDFYAHGVNVGDFDSDGLPDLLVTGYEGVALLHNLGDGTFRTVPAVEHRLPADGWLTSAAWLDLDADGHLDLYLTRYCDWSPDNDPPCEVQGHRDVCPPAMFAPLDDRLLLADGRGGLDAAGDRAGLVAGGKGLGCVAADLDLDGDTDVYVANDTTANFLYRNRGDGHLVECGLVAGVAVGPNGEPEGSMGVDAGDANLDGLPDLWVANFENQSFGLYRGYGESVFENVSAVSGVTAVGAVYVGFGTMFLDVDLDGAEDLFVANGHVMRFPTQSPLLQRPLLFHNRGGRRMQDVSGGAGPYFVAGHLGRGAAAGDIDGDGDDDLVVSQTEEPVALLVNETSPSPVSLAVRLVGTPANRDAIGGSAVLETTARRMLRQVKGGGSYLSSSSRVLRWGLAADERPLRLLVRWPGGRETATVVDPLMEPLPPGLLVVREHDADLPVVVRRGLRPDPDPGPPGHAP
ncbi:MAG: FG-GAP repeat domain-containing protein [Planctomycetia bacterium]